MNKDQKSSWKVAPNIALIKYWGKLETKKILPLNNSISFSFSTEDLFTETTVILSEKIDQDKFILNNVETKITSRIEGLLDFYREKKKNEKRKLLIQSYNNFPTASGLASSASGLAALALCLKDVFEFEEEYENQITEIARIGSGSACRSLVGGMVEWFTDEKTIKNLNWNDFKQGNNELNSSELSKICIAKQVITDEKLKNIVLLILIENWNIKETGSTDGMLQSVLTSDLLEYRVKHIVPIRNEKLKKSIYNENFNEMMEILSLDSNQFHAICQDTYPPIYYLTDFSRKIIDFVTNINKFLDHKIGYSFDAGSHAVLFIQKPVFSDIFKVITKITGIETSNMNEKAQRNKIEKYDNIDFESVELKYKNYFKPKFIIQTDVGSGPEKII